MKTHVAINCVDNHIGGDIYGEDDGGNDDDYEYDGDIRIRTVALEIEVMKYTRAERGPTCRRVGGSNN